MYWNDRHCVCCGNVCPDHQSLPERSGIHAAGGVASETVRGRNRKGEQLSSYETYTKSQQYVEDTAKSKLGLAYDNEIIFKGSEMIK